MAEFFGALGSVVLVLASIAVPAMVALRFFGSPPRAVRRVVFYAGAFGTPAVMATLSVSGSLPPRYVLYVSIAAILALSLGFPLLALRRLEGDVAAQRREQRTDAIFYLLSSVVWFTLLYWSGSSMEGLFFEVIPPIAGAAQPHCGVLNEIFICNHLTIWQALHYSAGNLLTLGAPGITPLDDISRFFTIVQMLPTFVAAYVLVRA